VDHSAAAKSSGAGGGDCGIVVADSHTDIDSMIESWKQNGIQQLALNVHPVIDLDKE